MYALYNWHPSRFRDPMYTQCACVYAEYDIKAAQHAVNLSADAQHINLYKTRQHMPTHSDTCHLSIISHLSIINSIIINRISVAIMETIHIRPMARAFQELS